MTLFQGIDPACQTFVIRFGPFVQPREFVAEAFDGRLEMCAELVANGHEVRFRRIRLERSLELRSEFLPRRIRSQLFAELACGHRSIRFVHLRHLRARRRCHRRSVNARPNSALCATREARSAVVRPRGTDESHPLAEIWTIRRRAAVENPPGDGL